MTKICELCVIEIQNSRDDHKIPFNGTLTCTCRSSLRF